LKELNDDEQQKWERMFWQPLIGENSSLADLRIEMMLNDSRTIKSNLTHSLKKKYFALLITCSGTKKILTKKFL